MRKLPLPILSFLLASAILLSGCVLYDYRTGQPASDLEKLGLTPESVNLTPDNFCAELPGPHPCYCMVCRNDTSWDWGIFNFLNPFFDTNLKGGECRFDNCNMTTFSEMLSNSADDILPRAFMIGHGPSFASTARSDLYCNYSLQLAVKWLKSPSEGATPRLQNPARAGCWLERSVLPLYIYYTNGSAIDPAWTGQFAASLEDAGAYPAMITTELIYDSSNAADLDKVKRQLAQIKQNCPNCLSVLAVQSGDAKAVNEILADPMLYGGRNLSNLTDMVGFGFLANDYPDCDPTRIVSSNIAFSRFILSNHSKPTIWLYVGASEGNNSRLSCQFSAQSVHQFYQKVFAAIPGLVSSGVVAMSFYEFTDGTGPLPCQAGQGCAYGVFAPDGSQKHPAINTWSSLCQFVGTSEYRNPVVFSRNGRGFVCDVFQNWKIYTQVSVEVNTDLGLKTEEVVPLNRIPKLTCGEACISDSANPNPSAYASSGSFPSGHCFEPFLLEELSDDHDFSSTYYRALIEQESSFNPMARSCVALSNAGCNTAGLSMAEICQKAGVAPAECPDECPNAPNGAPQKACAFGLAQCIEMPGEVNQFTSGCGGANYNPFNPAMSLCCGTNKFEDYLRRAQNEINSNWAFLTGDECGGPLGQGEKPWATYYLASLYYNGGPANSAYKVSSFRAQCANGIDNYINYLKSKNDYGAKVMSRYFSAVDTCGSDCPGR